MFVIVACAGVAAMDDVTRLMSTGDTVKIWDADSMTLLEQFNPHSGSHPVAQACWMANGILGCKRHSLRGRRGAIVLSNTHFDNF